MRLRDMCQHNFKDNKKITSSYEIPWNIRTISVVALELKTPLRLPRNKKTDTFHFLISKLFL